MAVDVVFGGVTYSIPEDDELGWGDLTNYLVALSGAQLGTSDSKASRIATSTPVLVDTSTDYAVGVNVASASVVTLPTGTSGQIFVIYDASGAAVSNNIVISGTGGQTINGLASYTILTNFGAVQLQFVSTEWKVISARDTCGENNQTNLSVIDRVNGGDNTGVNVTNLQSCTVTTTGSAIEFIVTAGDKAMSCSCGKNAASVNAYSDPDSMFLATDAGTGIVVTKAAGANVLTFKNRLGTAAVVKIRFTTGRVISATAWS
jgi:hypothetical protein